VTPFLGLTLAAARRRCLHIAGLHEQTVMCGLAAPRQQLHRLTDLQPACLASLHPSPNPTPHPFPARSGRQFTSLVQQLTCLCTAALQTYTAVTDRRNSDAYSYAINFEYLMATVRSFSRRVPPRAMTVHNALVS